CVFSSDTFKLFKPDPGMYQGAAGMLDLKPEDVMMVAAHKPDLRAAAQCGLRTAFVKRPLEHGRGGTPDIAPEPDFTVNAESFIDLADQLGC
ncbi:MAG: HAD hydrolase-like protein, partial [Burkholderiales bacterium]